MFDDKSQPNSRLLLRNGETDARPSDGNCSHKPNADYDILEAHVQKLLLMSVMFVLISVPIQASRDRNHVRALKRTLLLVAGFNVFYLLAIRFVYPHLQ